MRCAGSVVVRLFCTLGIFAIGLASVAQAAGADRNEFRKEREKRVLIATRAITSKAVQRDSTSAAGVSRAQRQFVQRLVSAAQRSLNYENGFIAVENRLIANQNRVIRQLNVAVNPNRILSLEDQGLALQASIDRDLTFINAVQPAISATLTAIQPFVSVVPGISGAFNRLERLVLTNDQKVAVIAARPPFTVPPATPAI
jgi:hypothetical protein